LNLIVTCPRHFESEAKEELRKILQGFGDDMPAFFSTDMSGIFTAETKIEGIDVVRQIKEMIREEPWSLRYVRRIIPVQVTSNTELEEIVKESLQLTKTMKEAESYRISIEKRNSSISSSEIISKIAENISNRVSMENYDWILLIEILGTQTGISILKNQDILSVEKEKRSISE
jgi:tRNA acetyltransferase TAN1